MCGIIGIFNFGEPKEREEELVKEESMIFFLSELLQLTEERGKDATGVVTLFSDNNYIGLKAGQDASTFLTNFEGSKNTYSGFLKIWRKVNSWGRVSLGHCRKPSNLGKAFDNNDNHPIKVDDIIGIHNGTIKNDDEIFKRLNCKRDGDVDSEAIFRLLSEYTNKGKEPFTPDCLKETCRRLDGTYAVISFSAKNPYQVAAFRDGRPMEALIIRPLNLLIIGSELKILKKALVGYSKQAHFYQENSDIKFKTLKKDDIDTKMLPDDSAFIFDLTKEIDSETKIESLYSHTKINRNDKVWEDTDIKDSYGYNNYTNKNYNTKTQAQINEERAKTKSTTTTSVPKSNLPAKPLDKGYGMVWVEDKACNKGDTELLRNVKSSFIVDIKNLDVLNLKKESILNLMYFNNNLGQEQVESDNTEEIDLEFVNKPLDDLIFGSGKISDKSPDDEDNYKSESNMGNNRAEVEVKSNSKPIEKEVKLYTPHPKGLELATKKVKTLQKLKSDKDVSEFLGIDNEDILKTMTIHAIANRLRNMVYTNAWANGYTYCIQEDPNVSDLQKKFMTFKEKNRLKRKSNGNLVKNLKHIIFILLSVIENSDLKDNDVSTKVENSVNRLKESGKIVDKEIIEKKIFFQEKSVKDFSTIRKIFNALK